MPHNGGQMADALATSHPAPHRLRVGHVTKDELDAGKFERAPVAGRANEHAHVLAIARQFPDQHPTNRTCAASDKRGHCYFPV
jgi:hypothetical protein